MKKISYPYLFSRLDRQFDRAMEQFESDPLFSSDREIYTLDDRSRLLRHWDHISPVFLQLQQILRRMYWRSFFIIGSRRAFIIRYVAVQSYYQKMVRLQGSFGIHEEWIRQYLDESRVVNYSSIARYMYHTRFLLTLWYPAVLFQAIRSGVSRDLDPLFDRDISLAQDFQIRWRHDQRNIFYYIRYRVGLILSYFTKRIGLWFAEIYFSRRTHGMITPDLLADFSSRLIPGDILMTRRNWAMTNVSIPGFWKHMSLYLGSGKSLQKYSHLLHLSLDLDEQYIVEAVGTGIRVTPLSTLTGHNDYIVALRPRFSSSRIDRAIESALSKVGMQYDFSFNFYSDASYVCSALVVKSYLREYEGGEGLDISLTRIATGVTYPPHDLALKAARESQTETGQLDFVAGIDWIEGEQRGEVMNGESFTATTSRSRFSFRNP